MFRRKNWLFSLLIGALSFILIRLWQQREAPPLQMVPVDEPDEILIHEMHRNVVQPPTPIQSHSAPSGRSATPDDLKKIEGIGPKFSGLLVNAGIDTFEKLSHTPTAQLNQILKDANMRLARTATWPEQASFAARGDWEGLKALQQELKGGVRNE